MSKNKILVISDLQMPFHHKDSLDFLKAVKKKYKPNKVINIGDVTDSYCLTAWEKDPEAISANEEIEGMLSGVKELGKMFPKVKVCISNHDLRLQRAAKRAGIPKHFIKDYHQWMGCPKGWTFHEEIEIDNILFTHGDEQGAGGMNASMKRAMHYGKSSVSGHLHTQANINYFANREKLIFGMQVGCLIDRKQLAFAYAKTALKKPVLTVGFIDRGIPILIPMNLDNEGRWTGKL